MTAGSPPVPPAPGPVPPPAATTLVTKLTAVGTLLTAVGVVMTAANGGFQTVYDRFKGTTQVQSQISAMDERLKLVEGGLKEDLPAIRAEAVKQAREIERRIDEALRSGTAIGDLQDRQRDLELRIERMDAMLQIMNGKRHK